MLLLLLHGCSINIYFVRLHAHEFTVHIHMHTHIHTCIHTSICVHTHAYIIYACILSSYPYWMRPAALSPMPPSRSPTLWPAPPSSLSRSSRAPSRGSRNSSSFFVATTQRMSSSTLCISYCWASTLALGRLIIWSLLQSKYIYTGMNGDALTQFQPLSI